MTKQEILLRVLTVIAVIFLCFYLTIGEALAVVNDEKIEIEIHHEELNDITVSIAEQELPSERSYFRNIVRGYEHDINTYLRCVNGQFSFKTIDEVAIKLMLYPEVYDHELTEEIKNLGIMMYSLEPDDIDSKNELEKEIARIGDELYEISN